MPPITANDLKTKGVAAIDAALAEQPDAVVSGRGKARFVVMELSHFAISDSQVRMAIRLQDPATAFLRWRSRAAYFIPNVWC